MKIKKINLTLTLPWILAFYYVSLPYMINMRHLWISYFFKSLILICALTTVIYFLFFLIIKKSELTALISSLFLILVNSYGLIMGSFEPKFGVVPWITNHYSLFILLSGLVYYLFIGIVLYILVSLLKKSIVFKSIIIVFVSIITMTLLVGNIFFLIYKQINVSVNSNFYSTWDKYIAQNMTLFQNDLSEKRDIYLIVLDGYGSDEILQNIYGYDNSWFSDELKSLGFIVVPNAKTNYSQTRTSFSSLLNMKYLDDISDQVGISTIDARPFITMISNNLVTSNLKSIGYKIINLQSEYEYTENLQSDFKLSNFPYINNLDQIIIYNSALYPFLHAALYQWHRDDVNYSLTQLGNLQKYPSPKFVMAHIYSPHPPFVFDSVGNAINPPYRYSGADANGVIEISSQDYYKKQYIEQIQYLSARALETVKAIQKNSDLEPIIILCGDHGPGLTVSQKDIEDSNHYERMHILNALYLPDIDPSVITDQHTPVNTFRIIFNEYFGGNYPILENRSFASDETFPYDFLDVTELSNTNLMK